LSLVILLFEILFILDLFKARFKFQLLGTYAKLRKATVRFVMPVCPSSLLPKLPRSLDYSSLQNENFLLRIFYGQVTLVNFGLLNSNL
jgi:hypothetical protein